MSDSSSAINSSETVTINITTLQEHPFEWTIPKNLSFGDHRSICLFFKNVSLEIIYFHIGTHKFLVRFPLIVPKNQRYECDQFTHSRTRYPPCIVNQGLDDGELKWLWQIPAKSLGNAEEMEKIINDGLLKACDIVPSLLEMIVKNLNADQARAFYDKTSTSNI